MTTERVHAKLIDCGDVLVGLGRIQSISWIGRESATFFGEWGWRLIVPLNKGRVELEREVRA